nr:reverse transcriptase domain-containing protein [Tanacetum cinerariifolium]
PNPQPQALGTTFDARVRDYMAAHTERMEIFKNAIFKQREEINEKRKKKNDIYDVATDDDSKETDRPDIEVSLKEVKTKNGAKNKAENKPIKKVEKDEVVEALSSQPVEYYLKHRNNEKLFEGLVDNNRFNDSLLGAQVRKAKGMTYNVLPRGPVYEAILKKKITNEEEIRGNIEIPCSIGGLKHVNALVNQGFNVNVMPYSTYVKLTDERLAETYIRLSLASHSYIYPLGIAKDVLVEVVEHVYPVEFVILDIKEDERRPFILGTPFLTTAKAGRGLQLSEDIEDSHVTLTLVNLDGQQEISSMSSQFVSSMLNPTSDACMESIFATASSPMAPLQTSTPIMTPSTTATITTISHAPIPRTTIPSKVLQNLPTFDLVICFDDRLKSLEAHFSEYIQTNPFAEVVSNILDENMKRIIKEQVKSQVKEQVSRILPRIEQFVNAQLEAKVLTRSSHSSRTSYAVAADLSEMELKKILIEKMEGYKSIQRSDKQRNLYKALVDAYEADKTILDSYGETAILKRRREDDDDQEGPFAGSDPGSKRRREGGEPESASTPSEPTTRSTGRSTTGSQSRQMSASESAFAEEPVQTTCQIDEPSYSVFDTGADDQPIVKSSQHPECFSQQQKPSTLDSDWYKTSPANQGSTQTWISELAKQADSRSSFNELLDTPLDFSNFIMNRLRVCLSLPSFGRHLKEIRVTLAHLEKKQTRLQTNIKSLQDSKSQSLETASPFIHDAVTLHLVTASQHFLTASAYTDSTRI